MEAEQCDCGLASDLGYEGVADGFDRDPAPSGVEHAGLAYELVGTHLADRLLGAVVVETEHSQPAADDQVTGFGRIAPAVQLLTGPNPTPGEVLPDVVEWNVNVGSEQPL